MPPGFMRFIWIFLVVIIFLNFFGSRKDPQQSQPHALQIIIADLPHKDFTRYLSERRVAGVTIFVDPSLQVQDKSDPKTYYLVGIPPQMTESLRKPLFENHNVLLVFTRDLSTLKLLQSYSQKPPARRPLFDLRAWFSEWFGKSAKAEPPAFQIRGMSYPDFLRKLDESAFSEITLLYREEVAVELAGSPRERIRYRVRLPKETAGDAMAALLRDAQTRNELIALDSSYNLGSLAPQKKKGLLPWWGWALIAAAALIVIWRYRERILNFLKSHDNAGGSSGGGVLRSTISSARKKPSGPNRVTFDDVAGIDEVKEEFEVIVEYLRHPDLFREAGAKMPKGVLLIGPSGVGKTLMAKAIAGEAGVPFFSIGGSEFDELYVGVGQSRVRDLFDKAKKSAPCLIFIDEIDAVGRQRHVALSGGDEERQKTLSQILIEMDGFDSSSGIIVIAATNIPEVLDPALIRPGRFDMKITIAPPSLEGRIAILKVHARGRSLAPDVNLAKIAKRAAGLVGADLANIVDEASRLLARRIIDALKEKKQLAPAQRLITQKDLEDAFDRILLGPARKGYHLSEQEKDETAYHEAGHAVVGFRIWQSEVERLMREGKSRETGERDAEARPVRKISILPTATAAGVTVFEGEDRMEYTKRFLLNLMAAAWGGRLTQQKQFNKVGSGAKGDLDQIQYIADTMVWDLGMGEGLAGVYRWRIGSGAFAEFREKSLSQALKQALETEVKYFIDQSNNYAREILEADWETVERLVKVLRDKEDLEAEEIIEIIGRKEEAFYSRIINGMVGIITRMIKRRNGNHKNGKPNGRDDGSKTA